MLTQRIEAWLATESSYEIGLDLLLETGYSGFTLTVLAMGEDAYNRARLEGELRKWLGKQENILRSGASSRILTKENSEVALPNILTKQPEMPNILTPEESAAVSAIRKQIYQLMDERVEAKAWLPAKMDLGNSEEACAERLPKAIRIKQITRQIDELYSQLDFYNAYQYLPLSASDPLVTIDDTAILLNICSYVSRYKGILRNKTLTPEKRSKAEALLKQYAEEKDRLENKLGKLTL